MICSPFVTYLFPPVSASAESHLSIAAMLSMSAFVKHSNATREIEEVRSALTIPDATHRAPRNAYLLSLGRGGKEGGF